jgi:hypothetical protein
MSRSRTKGELPAGSSQVRIMFALPVPKVSDPC